MQPAHQMEMAEPGTGQGSEPPARWGMTSQDMTGIGHWSLFFFTSKSFSGYTQLSGLHFQTTVYEPA